MVLNVTCHFVIETFVYHECLYRTFFTRWFLQYIVVWLTKTKCCDVRQDIELSQLVNWPFRERYFCSVSCTLEVRRWGVRAVRWQWCAVSPVWPDHGEEEHRDRPQIILHCRSYSPVWRDCWWCWCCPAWPHSPGGSRGRAWVTLSGRSPAGSSTWARPWRGWWGPCQATIPLLTTTTINITTTTWVGSVSK